MLEKILEALGLNQLVVGFALYVCTVATYGSSSQDPHSTLGYALSSLSMLSQLQVPLVLRPTDYLASRLGRAFVLLVYSWALLITMAVGFRKTRDVPSLVTAVVASIIAILAQPWTAGILLDILGLTFISCIGLTLWSLVHVLQLKFSPKHAHGCDLNTAQENQ